MKKIVEKLKAASNIHTWLLLLTDVLVLTTDALLSFIFVSHFQMKDTELWFRQQMASLILTIAFTILGFVIFKVYKGIIKYAMMGELLKYVVGILFGAVTSFLVSYLVFSDLPIAFYILYVLFAICTICIERMLFNYTMNYIRMKAAAPDRLPTLIIGAGFTGTHVAQEIERSSTANYHPVGFVDDNQSLWGRVIDNIPILGPTILIPELCKKHKVKVILFAIPTCEESRKLKILSICAQTNCEIKIIPSMFELTSEVKFLPQMKSINVEEVLGREVVELDSSSDFRPFAKGKTIMVTGVGSIGSEICRQVIKCDIKKLVMVDIYENNAYDIQQELVRAGYGDKIVTEIASVRDYDKIKHLFEIHKPDIVFHAAAHKHVPLMEFNPEEAIKNNVLGTYNVSHLCRKFEVKKMVLISTDKAVNPTNVMGASKRCCEMIMQYMAQKQSKTEFVAVRFGNVLGSNGSVIPLFIKQIENGGPVTVTHPDIIRYFMTIPEAVSLVLEAGAMAKNGEIFVLDMGEPFKITTLAENLIRLYGYEPYTEMPIVFTGLRPGEKLFEELLMAEEGLKSTKNKSIFIGNQIEIDSVPFKEELNEIIRIAKTNRRESVVEALEKMVPTFKHKL